MSRDRTWLILGRALPSEVNDIAFGLREFDADLIDPARIFGDVTCEHVLLLNTVILILHLVR